MQEKKLVNQIFFFIQNLHQIHIDLIQPFREGGGVVIINIIIFHDKASIKIHGGVMFLIEKLDSTEDLKYFKSKHLFIMRSAQRVLYSLATLGNGVERLYFHSFFFNMCVLNA
jgi:hypothetical protein